MFYNRSEAGRMLAARLKKFYNTPSIVLAIPRGGVPVAYEVAKELKLPLQIILTKKLGHPLNKEYAIGAIGLTDRIVVAEEEVPQTYIERETERIRDRLNEMNRKFMGNSAPENLKEKVVIVVDDGIATGTTLLATIKILRKSNPSKIVVTAPVASRSAIDKIAPEADELIVLYTPEAFGGVSRFYEDFQQVSDEEVLYFMNKFRQEIKKANEF